MATKDEVLQYIKNLANQKLITKEEILNAYNEGSGIKADAVFAKKLKFAEVLYYIGGAIIFLGIVILIAQNWSNLSFLTKVLATLVSGVVAYFVGILLSRDKRTEGIGSAFHLIAALVIPIGLYVVFDNAGFDVSSLELQSLISGILLITYLASFFSFRKNLFLLFSILFGTWFFFSFVNFIIGDSPFLYEWHLIEYQVLFVGLSYMLLGYSFSKSERSSLTGFLYGFGIMGFLGAALSLGGTDPNQNIFWELFFPVLIFIALFLSVQLKSKAFLTFGTIYLMIYIIKITFEYFENSLGWSLALVLAGFSVIAVGYMSVYLKNKYIS